MDIDRTAPAVASAEAEIDAPPETVWDVLTDFQGWPDWNPAVKSVALEGAVTPGSVVRWKAGRATITSTLAEIERPRLIGWTGKTTGIDAVHVWTFEPRDGGTRAQTEESWSGLLVRLLRGTMRKSLQRALDDGLVHLKAEAERRAQAAG